MVFNECTFLQLELWGYWSQTQTCRYMLEYNPYIPEPILLWKKIVWDQGAHFFVHETRTPTTETGTDKMRLVPQVLKCPGLTTWRYKIKQCIPPSKWSEQILSCFLGSHLSLHMSFTNSLVCFCICNMTFECHLFCPSPFDLDIQVHSRNDHRDFLTCQISWVKHFHDFVCNQSGSLNLKSLNQSILMLIHPYCCTGTSPTRGGLWVTLKDTIRHFVYHWDSIDPIATKHGVGLNLDKRIG